MSLVVSGTVSTVTTGHACVDIGTGLIVPPDFYVKAPFPRTVSSYAVGPISVSLISTIAVDLQALSIFGDRLYPSVAISWVANGLGLPYYYNPGGDLSK